MEGRWRKGGGRSVWVEECGGNVWREMWRKEERKVEEEMLGFWCQTILEKYYFDYDRMVVG